jgi:hypothetical protein
MSIKDYADSIGVCVNTVKNKAVKNLLPSNVACIKVGRNYIIEIKEED